MHTFTSGCHARQFVLKLTVFVLGLLSVALLSTTKLAAASITYVQSNDAVPQTPQTSVTVTFTAAQAAGDLNVVVVGWNNSTATVASVTDSSKNTYTLAVGPTIQSGVAAQSIYYAKNIVAAGAGANIVTVTFASSATNPDIRILEYSGADTNNPVDVTAANSGSSGTSSSGSVTTTNASDLLFGANLVQTVTTAAGSGFTKRLITSPDGDIAEDEMVTATGSYSATATVQSGQWIMQLVAFRTPSSDTSPPTAPTNLAASVNGTQINLSWTASTDNVGVTGYLIERCAGSGCSNFAQIGTSTTTTYSDTGLVASTSYSYRVRATDAAGNLSSYSNITSATTGSGPATITYVQGAYSTPQTPQTSVAVTYSAAQTAGDLNVIVVGWNDAAVTVSSVTDSSNNTYTLAVGPTTQTGLASQSIYYAKNILAAGAGANAVTVKFSGSAVSPDVRILEYKGADPNSPVDVTASNTGNSATASSGTVTTTSANELLFGADLVQSVTTGPGAGFTSRLLTSPDGDIAEDEMVTAIGGYSATAALQSGQWIMQLVAFRTPSTIAPTVTGVVPNNGSTAGGTAVTISGTNFSAGASVTFGGVAATNIQVVNSTTITASTPAGSTGAATVAVTVAGESGSLANGFSYIGTPTVSGVSPNTGSTAGGTAVTITGTNFAAGAMVVFGTTAATNVVVVSSTSITATTPAGTGAVTVTVANPGPQSGSLASAFTYQVVPGITSISPNVGSTAGGTAVTITGGNFSSPATVNFGTAAATNVVVVNSTTITATTPANSAGAVTVTVGIGGQNASLTNGFTYVGVPTVTSVAPNTGSTGGGTAVTITGTNFATGATVTFGSAAASNVKVVSSTSITANTPPGAPGATTVTVTNPGSVSGSLSNGFTYANATTITYVQSNSATPQTPQTTVSVAYTSAQSAGNLNVVVVGWNDGTSTVSKVADTSGNTYTLAVGPTVQSGVASQSVYYARNIKGASSGANSVTVTFSSAATAPDIRILEYSGADPNYPVDVVSANSGSGTSSNSGTVTTTNASDLLFGANLVQTVTTAAGTGFTKRLLTSPDGDIAEDEMVTTVGSYSASATLTSGQWIMQMVAFRTTNTTPPTTPSGLSATTIGNTQINLSWTGSTGPVGVSAYLIQRCAGAGCTTFAQVGTSTTTTYNDTTLSPATSYTYRVQATDADGNLSGFSNTATSVTSGPTLTAPTGLTVSQGGPAPTIDTVVGYMNFTATTSYTTGPMDSTGGDLIILAASSHNGVTFTPTDTYNNTWIPLAGPTTDSNTATGEDLRTAFWYAWNPTVGPNHTVTMTVSTAQTMVMSVIVVKGSNISSPIDTVSLINNDGGTVGINVVSPTITTTGINELLLGYAKVGNGATYVAGQGFTLQPDASSAFLEAETESAATPGSYDATFTLSAAQNWQSAIVALANNKNQTTITWSPATDTGGTISNYLVWRCQGASCTTFTNVGTTATTTFNDSGLAASTSYTYEIQAQDASSELGPLSTPVTIVTPATSPSIPGDLAATASSNTEIDLNWSGSKELGGTVQSYVVQRCLADAGTNSTGQSCTNGFATIATLPASTTTYSDTGLNGGVFNYQVRAVDSANNVSPFSNTASASVPDTAAPSAPSGLGATAGTTASQISLTWTPATDNVGVTSYLVERCSGSTCTNFVQIATTTGTTYVDSSLATNTTFRYQIQATDAAGNIGAASNIASALTPNLPVPSAPSGVSLTDGGPAPVVDTVVGYINSTEQTVHTTGPLNSTGGDLIILAASSHMGVTMTPTDTYNNTWTPLAGPTSTTVGEDLRTQFWFAWNPTVGANHTVTITLSQAESLVMSVIVVKGSNISSPIDVASLINSDNGTPNVTPATPSITTTGINELLVGFVKVSAGATFTAGTNFTLQPFASSNFLEAETGTAATPGSYNATWTLSAAQDWQSALIAVANSQNQTTLTWSPSTGGSGTIANYLVWRCQGASCTTFTQVGTPTTTSFNDTGLTASTSYTYEIQAKDSVGTLSPLSAQVTVVTPAASPSIPGEVTATAASNSQINVAWSASKEIGATVQSYVLQRCLADAGTNSTGQPCTNGFVTLATLPASTTTYSDTGLTGGVFNYRVQAIDSANNVSPYSNIGSASVPDTVAPTTPSSLTATAGTTTSQVSLSWTASTDNVGVTGYLVERCPGSACTSFVQIGTATGTTYVDSGLTPNTTYRYEVFATDLAGNISGASNIATAITPNLPVPSAPSGISVTDGGSAPVINTVVGYINPTSLTVHTTGPMNSTGGDLIILAASSHMGVTLTPTDTYNNTWTPIAGPTSTTIGDDLRTQLWYAWNPTVGPNHTVTITLSEAQPLVISVLVVKGSNISSPIDVASLINSDNGTQNIIATTPNITTTGINDLLIGFVKVYVGATYTAGNGFTLQPFASSNFLEAETGTAPTPGSYNASWILSSPQNWESAIVAINATKNQTTLTWSPATGGSGTIASYSVWRCQGAGCSTFTQIGTSTTTSYNDTGLTASTSYTYEVQAEDSADSVGPISSSVTIVTPANTPSMPGELTATAASNTQINIAWAASNEVGGNLQSYVLQRCLADAGTNSTGQSCTNGFATIATLPASTTTYSDTGLTGGVFNYRIQAVDSANNVSPYSNTASASVPDTVAPTTPSGLTATGATTTSQVSLSWTGSTDNVGVTGYLIERCPGSACTNFVQIGTATSTTYVDSGLSPNTTFRYEVLATDLAGNVSSASNIASASTPNLPIPTAPTGVSVTDGGAGATVVSALNDDDTSYTTSHLSAPFNSTGGNLIVLYGYSIGGVTFTPSDSYNNTWTPIAGPTSTTSGTDVRTQLWYAWNPTVGPNHTVTMTLSTGEPLVMSILVLAGANVSSPIDVVSLINSDNGSPSATVSSPSITTTGTNDLLLGFTAVSAGATFTAGTGFTLQAAASSNFLEAEAGLAATPGSYAATFVLSSNQDWESSVVAVSNSKNQTTLTWSPATGGSGTIASYLVWRCQGAGCSTFTQVGTSTTTSFNDTGLTASTSYTYEIQAEDSSDSVGPLSTSVTIVTPGYTPSMPGALTATASSNTQINLAWSAANEVGGNIQSYVLQRCLADAGANSSGQSCTNGFATIATLPAATTTYSDTGLTGGVFNYRVQAIDSANNVSPYSNTASASVPDTIAPTAPSGLTATPGTTTSQVTLTWTASTDNVGVTGYLVERCSGSACTNFAQIGTAPSATYVDAGLTPSTTFRYEVFATDLAGNVSAASNIATASTANLPVPSAPTGLSTADGGTGPTVIAMQNDDDSAFVTSHKSAPFNSTGGNLIVLYGYSIGGVTFTPSDSLDNVWIPIAGPTSTTSGTDIRTQLWYAWNPLVGSGQTVTINLSAGEPLVMSILVIKDANLSSPIEAVSLIGSDNGMEGVSVVSPSLTTTSSNDLLLGFTAVGTGATFTAGNGFTQEPAASSAFLDAEAGPAATPGTYNATFGLSSQQDWEAVVTAASNNPDQVTLSWSASTETGGTVADYLIWRCEGVQCTNFSQIGTSTTTTFNDTTLTAGASYSYEVQAEDSNSTLGPLSSPITFVVPTPIPSLPGNLTVTAASSTQNNLSWIASQEIMGGTITDYLVERCQGTGCTNFSQIATPATTSYVDTVLANMSYTYRVRAKDGNGNIGPYSNVATDTTPNQ